MACALRALRPEFALIEKYPFLHSPAIGGSQTVTSSNIIPAERLSAAPFQYPLSPPDSTGALRREIPKASGLEKFRFWYIGAGSLFIAEGPDLIAADPSGSRTPSLSSAMVRLDPDDFINLRKIEFTAAQRSHPFAAQLRLVNRKSAQGASGSSEETFYGFIVEDGAPPSCSRFEAEVRLAARSPQAEQPCIAEIHHAETYDDDWIEPQVHSARKSPHALGGRVSAFSRTASAPGGPARGFSAVQLAEDAAAGRAAQVNLPDPHRSHSAGADVSLPSRRYGPRLSSHVPSSSYLEGLDDPCVTTTAIPDFQPSDVIIFPAGSYDVILILDTREVESRTSRDKIAEALEAKGVKVETRALRLGDMCWIARRRDGLGAEEDECVLDYVVERKRLDDLCSSIKDGRYNEQCVGYSMLSSAPTPLKTRS